MNPEINEYKHESPYLKGIRSDIAYKEAKEKGLQIVLPDEHTLQIDIDSKEAFSLFERRISFLEKWYDDIDFKITTSLSGLPNRHIYITMSIPITPLERVFLQLFLGSDSTREFLSFKRIEINDPHPTLFFEKR
jgi:hypothetical protein